MHKRFLTIAGFSLLASLALGGCQGMTPAPATATGTSVASPPAATASPTVSTEQAAVTSAFNIICDSLPTADLVFHAVSAFSNVIDQAALNWESATYAGFSARCAAPPPDLSTLKTTLAEVQGGIKTIMDVVAAAKANPKPASS